MYNEQNIDTPCYSLHLEAHNTHQQQQLLRYTEMIEGAVPAECHQPPLPSGHFTKTLRNVSAAPKMWDPGEKTAPENASF